MSAVFLLGFMGCGKSAVARHIARALRMPLIDLDGHIEAEIGLSIADYFAKHGEDAFREVETRVLREVCGQNAVVSLGGGVPTRETNRFLLKKAARRGALVAYLQTDPQTLTARIRRAPGKRPLIDGDGELDFEATLRRVELLMSEREGFYLDCANCVVKTDSLSIADVALRIETAWQRKHKTPQN